MSSLPPRASAELRYTWGKPEWLPWSCEEQRATREAVTVFDQTSFGKISITGADAEAFLQRVCSADVAVETGRCVYTAMLNHRGGYEADVTVTRTADDSYLLVTGSASIVRDTDWLRRHIGDHERVTVADVTESSAVFGVMGPRSRELLQSLTDHDLSDRVFPFSTSQLINLGYATVRATRITYVGELGWELYVPVELGAEVYQTLVDAGAGAHLQPAGYYAINSLRLDMGYRAFAAELTPDYTPVEAGLLFACDLKGAGDWVGRASVERAKEAGVKRRLVSVVLQDPEVMLWGGELVLRDGDAVGQITSAAWSQTLGAAIALAYVWRPDDGVVTTGDLSGDGFVVNVGGQLCEATLSARPPRAMTSEGRGA